MEIFDTVTMAVWRDEENGVEIAALALTAEHEGQAIAAPTKEYLNFVEDCKAWSRFNQAVHDSGEVQYLKMNAQLWPQWHEVYEMCPEGRARYELDVA
ncbi:MAG: hypothetical protein AAGJ80_14055 [Cyanobacteria bacterium J06553_1]